MVDKCWWKQSSAAAWPLFVHLTDPAASTAFLFANPACPPWPPGLVPTLTELIFSNRICERQEDSCFPCSSYRPEAESDRSPQKTAWYPTGVSCFKSNNDCTTRFNILLPEFAADWTAETHTWNFPSSFGLRDSHSGESRNWWRWM